MAKNRQIMAVDSLKITYYNGHVSNEEEEKAEEEKEKEEEENEVNVQEENEENNEPATLFIKLFLIIHTAQSEMENIVRIKSNFKPETQDSKGEGREGERTTQQPQPQQ